MLAVRPGRLRALVCVFAGVVTTEALSTGCGSSSSDTRPATSARMQIVQPTPNAVTGADVTVEVKVVGGKLVTATAGELTPDEGHAHLTLDGDPYVMSYRGTRTFQNLAPGPHSLQVEFVAKDHGPFANRPRAFVRFNVGG